MRTLKKTLSLVLVLAMMVGLCAIGASAITIDDYKDKDAIPNPEAIAMLTAIGIFQGDDTGNLRPNDALNRAEGATVATKMHATSGVGASSFSDMGAYAWAQPAVAYCEQNGIIAGYGDGTFGPADALTTVAFAKMCVTALGFDAAKEGLLGSQWEINTIKLVNALNLADGIGNLDWNAPIPRWQAGQFVFNTLQSTMVDYNGLINMTVTTSDGTKVEVGTGASAIENKSYDYRGNDYDGDPYDYEMQFIENYFPNVKCTGRSDDFGYPTRNWFIGKNRNDNTWQAAKQIAVARKGEVMATYTNPAATTIATVYGDSGWNDKGIIPTYENGEEAYGVTQDVFLTASGADAAKKLSQYGGATASLVDMWDNGEADELIVKYAYPAQVMKVTPANKTASAKRELTLWVYNQKTGGHVVATVASDEYNQFDVLLAYPKGNIDTTSKATAVLDIKELAKADVVQGKLTKITNGANGRSAFTVDGVSYSIASGFFANMGAVPGTTVANCEIGLNGNYTLYLANGEIVGLAGEAPSYTNYVFAVNNKSATDKDVTRPGGETSSWSVGIVHQDGSAEAVTATGNAAPAQGWYTVNTVNGITDFTAPSGKVTELDIVMTKNNGQIKKDTPTIATNSQGYKITADANTAFIFYTGALTGYKTYTGIANVPTYSIKDNTSVTAYALVVDTIAKAVFIDLSTQEETDSSTETIYVLSDAILAQEKDATTGAAIYTYSAIVDGKFGTIQSTLPNTGSPKILTGLVKPTRNSAGYISGTAPMSGSAYVHTQDTSTAGITFSGGTLTFGGASYATDGNTQVFYYAAPGSYQNVEAGTPEELIGLTNVDVTATWTSSSKVLKAVYVVPLPSVN